MNKADVRNAKREILKALTEDLRSENGKVLSQAIFDKKEGYAYFSGTDLQMVMDKVVIGLYRTLDEGETA